MLLNKSADPGIEDDSKRDKVKSNYSVMNLRLEGSRSGDL